MKIASYVLGFLALGTLVMGNFLGFIIFGVIAFLLFRQANSAPKKQKPHKKTDKPGIITVNQKPPKDYTEQVVAGVSVAGITRPEREDSVKGFIEGSARKVRLEPEPDNAYDPNAIRVMGIWKEGGEEKEGMLGYIPKEIAADIEQDDIVGCVNTVYRGTEDYNPGVKIDIYTTSAITDI